MRSGRLELPHPKIRVPKTRASTNSATTALFKILVEYCVFEKHYLIKMINLIHKIINQIFFYEEVWHH